MVEREKTTDYESSLTTLDKKWKGKNLRLAHFLVALVLVIGGVLVASYVYNQYSQPIIATQFIGYNLAYQNGINTPDKGLPSIPGTEIVPVAQSGWYNDTNTAAGTIEFDGMELPSEFPLCINNDWLADYWVAVEVTGGYTPESGCITVYQKGERQGWINVDWELMNPDACCCAPKIWNATFSVCHSICLDSNQYPAVSDDWNLWWQGDWQTIPGKDVDLKISTVWSGCWLEDQEFVIIPVQNN